MDFLKNNKSLITLGLTIVLVVLGLVFKVDVSSVLGTATTVKKEVGTLIDDTAPPAKPVE